MKPKRSWRTTLGGCIGAVGVTLTQIDDPLARLGGAICTALGLFLVGYTARDNKLTSEDVGAN